MMMHFVFPARTRTSNSGCGSLQASSSQTAMFKLLLFVAPFCIVSVAEARTFTVIDSCPFTIWPALFTDLNVAPNVPNQPTGWVAAPGTSVSFPVPDNWKAGRIWARRECDFTTNPGPLSCKTGGCNGGLLCDNRTGTGVPPVSVAEWTLQGDGNTDFYDVSLVDGFDLPMRIDNSAGCPIADCPVDLNAICPGPLIGPKDPNGATLGCNSACNANLDGNQADSPNCCSGSHNLPATCPASGVQFYSFFKGSCPNAYAYAYDESSNTALWTCDSGLNADYTLTFCPPATANQTTLSSAAVTNAPSAILPSTSNTVLPQPSPLATSPSSTPSAPTSRSSSSTDMWQRPTAVVVVAASLVLVVILDVL